MKLSSRLLRRIVPGASAATLAALAIVAVTPVAAHAAPVEGAGARHLIYLPSRSTTVDQGAIIDALGTMGFSVNTLAYTGENQLDYARRVAAQVRTLIAQGVAPDAITVLGAGTGSPVAVLTSAVTGNRRVNYVLLGQCDAQLKADYHFRMSGEVLGLRDAGDTGSHSCRPLWASSPKVGQRRDMVLGTGHGAALFDQPRAQWLQPVADWSGGGRVDVGNIRIGAVERRTEAAGRMAQGLPD